LLLCIRKLFAKLARGVRLVLFTILIISNFFLVVTILDIDKYYLKDSFYYLIKYLLNRARALTRYLSITLIKLPMQVET
jgi:hypothetical protein